jgi:internalin A
MNINLILTLIGLAITIIAGIGGLITNLSSKISKLEGRLDTLGSETRLQEQVEKIQKESIHQLQQRATEWHDQLATDLAQQQTQVHASLQLLKTQEASSVAVLTDRARQLVQQFQEIEQAVKTLRQEKVSTRLANLEVQLENIQSVISLRKLWWSQLDEPWPAIFKEAIGIKGEPTKEELEAILRQTELKCYENKLTHLEPLRALTGLQTLDCWNNQLTNLEPLRACTGLQTLNCWNNQLTSLEGLQACPGLQSLHCSYNQLTSLEPLRALMGLQELGCNRNPLTSLEPLHGLKNLKELNCHNNPSLSQAEIERFKRAVPSCQVKS